MHQYKSRMDGIGITAAIICMAHCVLIPVVFSILSIYGSEAAENIWLEIGLLGTSIVIGGWAIWKGYQQFHHKLSVVFFFILGIALLAAGNVVETTLVEMVLKFAGASILIATHIYNWKRCKSCTVFTPKKELAES